MLLQWLIRNDFENLGGDDMVPSYVRHDSFMCGT